MITVDITIYLSIILLIVSILGFTGLCKHVITLLVALEFLLLAVSLSFISFSYYLDDLFGQVYTLFILTIAAAESSIALAIIVLYYRIRGVILLENINMIKG